MMASPPRSAEEANKPSSPGSYPVSAKRTMPPLISVPSDSSANTPRPSLQLGSNNTSFLSFSEMLSPLNSAEWSTAPLCPPPRTPPPTLPASEASEQPATRTTTTRTTSPNNSRRQWSSIERQQFMASMEADRLVNSNDELAVLERPAINYQDGVSRESHSTLDDYFSQSEYDEDEDGEVAVATTQSFSSWTVQPVTPVKKKPSVSQSLNEERLYRVRSLRNARTANHINEFVRILITTLEEDTEILTGSNRPEPKTFPVTVHRGHTVEELTRIIEAEHAFIYGEPAPPPVPMRPLPLRSDTRVNAALPPNSANSAESSTGRRPSCSQPSPVYRAYRPLVCGQLFVGTVPLKYDDLIGEILDMNDVVRVINIYEEEITGEPHNNSAATSFVNLEASEANRSATALNKGGSSPKGDYNLCKVESNDTAGVRSYRSQPGGLEDRFRQCIYNEFALAAFQTHCAREFTLESLLFFLEIEVFRELAELEPSKLPPGVQLEHYARYIYEIYIDNDAPLQINISEEVREEVANTGNCWSGLFDEAQDMVQAMIKRHSFVRFETSDAHVLLTRLRQQDPTRYYAADMQQPMSELFPPNAKLMSYILNDTQKPRASSSSFQRQRFEISEEEIMNMCRAREETLARALSRFHPGPDVTAAVDGYFADETARLTPAQKQRCVSMGRKLMHFFGQHPDPLQLQKQVETTEAEVVYSTQQPHQLKTATSTNSLNSVQSRASITSINSLMTNDTENNTPTSGFQNRRRRLRKLEGFFGDRLPGDIVPATSSGTHPIQNNSSTSRKNSSSTMEYNNNSYSTNNSSLQKARRPNKITKKNPNQRPALLRVSEDIDRDMLGNQRGAPSSPLPQNDTMDNSNELDPDVRRELRRRRHKLNKLFGEPLNEEMVFKQLVKPSLNSIGSTSEMMAVGVMSSTPVTSTAAAAITAATTTTATVTITATAAAAAATKSPMSAPTPISAASITAIHSPSTTDFILDQSYLYDEEQQPQQSTSSSVATILLDSHSVRSRSMVSLLNRNSDNDTPNTSMRNRSISIDTVSTVTHHVPFNRSENRTMNTTNTNYTNEQQAREQRRKKVEKLFRVLGVHVPAEMINAAQERINSHRDTAPHAQTQYAQPLPTVVTAISVAVDDNGPNTMSMSASEKRAGVRRAEKLERMFGARPPQDLVVASTLPSPLSRDSCGDSAIVQLDTTSPSPASQRHSLLDLLDMEDDNYPAEGGYGMTDELGNTSLLSSSLPIDGASLISLLLEDDATVDSLLEYVSSPDISYEDPNTPEAIHDKSVRQRRLRKLKRFFGHELEETIM